MTTHTHTHTLSCLLRNSCWRWKYPQWVFELWGNCFWDEWTLREMRRHHQRSAGHTMLSGTPRNLKKAVILWCEILTYLLKVRTASDPAACSVTVASSRELRSWAWSFLLFLIHQHFESFGSAETSWEEFVSNGHFTEQRVKSNQ